jgi:hypothetical protein
MLAAMLADASVFGCGSLLALSGHDFLLSAFCYYLELQIINWLQFRAGRI